MKNIIFKVLVVMMLLCVVFTFAACDQLPFFGSNNDGTNDDGGNDDIIGDDVIDAVKNLVLVENGKANFQVVFTESTAGNSAILADNFVTRLKSMGALPKDAVAVSDSEKDKVKDCEIIIGAEALNRGEECSVSTKYLGEDGETVKVVGNRVIIATGKQELLKNRFDNFVRNQLGISNSATSINDTILIERSYLYEKFTKYLIESIKFNGNDMRDYTLVLDLASVAEGEKVDSINAFRNNLYDVSGYWLNVGTPDKIDTYKNAFIIRAVDDAGQAGFRALVEENGNVVVECAYDNAFDLAFSDFAANVFINASGNIKYDYATKVNSETQQVETAAFYEKTVSVAYYEDFGAVGDGKTCSFEAIYNTHLYANRGGQKVMSRGGISATYYISPSKFTKSIPVKTDVDLNGCTILVDDVGSDAFKYYGTHLFNFTRDVPEIVFDDVIKNKEVLDANGNPTYNTDGSIKMTVDNEIDDERFQNIKLMNKTEANKDDPNVYDNFSWLVSEGLVDSQCLIRITNKNHRDFIRHGSNQNSGNPRTDVFVVYADGTISEETPIVYEFEDITKIEIFRTDDKPITFENGNFINICCRTVADTTYTTPSGVVTKYACKWRGYQRTLGIFRTNVTIKNLHHELKDEPTVGWIPTGSGYVKDIKHNNFGSRHESYPYYGFFYIYNTYNFNAYDSVLTGHTTYYEDKPATASTGWKIPDPVAMGTYDLIIEYSSHVYLHNVVQVNSSTPETGIADGRYWGIMSSNGARNIFFYDCEINRFDAHRGFWNAELHNTVIGHSFQVVGGGYLLANNVTKVTKGNYMTFRGDYGATFNGDITLIDCTHLGFETYNTARGQKDTTKDNANRNVRQTCCIFDPGFSGDNTGWDSTPGKTPEEAGQGAYWLWYFGYECYMPRNIVIDNFTYGCAEMYVFDSGLPDEIFEPNYVEGEPVTIDTVKYGYHITESITFRNTEKIIPITSDPTNTRIKDIPVTWVRDEEEQ